MWPILISTLTYFIEILLFLVIKSTLGYGSTSVGVRLFLHQRPVCKIYTGITIKFGKAIKEPKILNLNIWIWRTNLPEKNVAISSLITVDFHPVPLSIGKVLTNPEPLPRGLKNYLSSPDEHRLVRTYNFLHYRRSVMCNQTPPIITAVYRIIYLLDLQYTCKFDNQYPLTILFNSCLYQIT